MATIQQSDIEFMSSTSECRPRDNRSTVQDLSPVATYNTKNDQENTPLIGTQQLGYYARVKKKFWSQKCCLRSSKAAILILVWNLIISLLLSLFDPTLYMPLLSLIPDCTLYPNQFTFVASLAGAVYVRTGILFLFYPLCGCLADVRWGRHKTVLNSLCFVLCGTLSLTVLVALLFVTMDSPAIFHKENERSSILLIIGPVFTLFFGISICIGLMLVLCSLVAFNANIIQFGTDQLHDAPTDESRLYITWYMWTGFAGSLVLRSTASYTTNWLTEGSPFVYFCTLIVFPLVPFLVGITLCIYKCKRNLFLIESGSRNPYKLVYKILKFAKEHTNPIRRSAFTYCEDELPSRLDLAKEKYGGPFTTEEVEDVKVFTGILCVLLTIGPTFLVDVAVNGLIPGLAITSYLSTSGLFSLTDYINVSGFMTPMIIVIIIPLYLCLLQPFIHDYIPGILKRIGLGMILLFISGVCTLIMGLIPGHGSANNTYTYDPNCSESISTYITLGPNYLLIQCSLNAIGYMLLYIASYEFICAQSPHSMKGFLIGTFFAIKGVFQLIGVLVLYIPITILCSLPGSSKFPLCGFVYYIINIVIALVGIIAFIYVARKYQYRKRDEPDNIYRYAEEYYAKAEDEPNYDYDDYDNLNCETIREEST